jgi:hypothetical protein
MLANLLLNAGLLQFGRFAHDGGWKPYQLNLELLPSYPDILGHIVDSSAPLVGSVDHLLCPLTALPFGVALSQQTGVPLVYGRDEDIVGAYDIGHPALLIANDLSKVADLERLIARARRVGLETRRALVIINEAGNSLNGVEVEALLDLSEVIQALMQEGRLPAGQGRAVLDWITLHHPD